LRPDEDKCQPCPRGLKCHEDATTEPLVEGSSWVAGKGVYKLTSCPKGYFRISGHAEWEQQRCEPCEEGAECVSDECNNGHCSPCAAGKYKDVKGTLACRICPPDSFNPDANSKDFTSCRASPAGSNTRKKDGQASVNVCLCAESFYEVYHDSE
jgi:hypothetical protein